MKANRAINPRFAKALFVFFAQKRRLLSVWNQKRLFLFEDWGFSVFPCIAVFLCFPACKSPSYPRTAQSCTALINAAALMKKKESSFP